MRRAEITERVFAIKDEETLMVLLDVLNSANGPALLQAVHAVLANADIPSNWHELLCEADMAEIEQSKIELAAGNAISHGDLIKELRGWAKR